ncbi:MAG: D-alanyl-D-alanine carboxypeptidase [Acidobacteriota bacterium]
MIKKLDNLPKKAHIETADGSFLIDGGRNMRTQGRLLVSLLLLFLFISPSYAASRFRHKSARTPVKTTKLRAHKRHLSPATGIYVQTLAGKTLYEVGSEELFNPASVIKIATSLIALERLGYGHRFATHIYTNGTINQSGELNGDLIIVGAGDPAFFYENAFMVTERLRGLGIDSINGDLIVIPPFYLNFNSSVTRSAEELLELLKGENLSPAAAQAWLAYSTPEGQPAREYQGIQVSGDAHIANAMVGREMGQQLLTHLSRPLTEILKSQNDFSNNFMAEAIGNHIGGPRAIERFLVETVGIPDQEIYVGNAAGLGENRITPRAALQLIRHFYQSLISHGKRIEDLLPVAGIDAGTLEDRFTDPAVRGSVVAKTGTLAAHRVSALVGLAYTREQGVILFAILNRDIVTRARQQQDEFVSGLLTQYGGVTTHIDAMVDQPEKAIANPIVIISENIPR